MATKKATLHIYSMYLKSIYKIVRVCIKKFSQDELLRFHLCQMKNGF